MRNEHSPGREIRNRPIGCAAPKRSQPVGRSTAAHRFRSRLLRQLLDDHPELVTAYSACRMCRVDLEMVCRWIDGGLWPFPRRVYRRVFLFQRADVERWISTGEWPQDCLFREPWTWS